MLSVLPRTMPAIGAMAVLMAAAPAFAAEIANSDAEPVVLRIVEAGVASEITLEAGAEASLCATGCFVTLPNGDRIGLSGDEILKIVNGAAVLK